MTTKTGQTWLKPALLGPLVVLALNLVGLFLLGQPAALFLSNGWWSAWFPAYLVTFLLIVIGMGYQKYIGNREN